ncbi:MAG: hypothetical protein DRH57_05360 [Candidatus Cloacimonadota bacterium]|nr:MAG: hypothetical protein DRH57_05360 [Candidatus Cloacimonadota bacterium]
MEKMIAYCGIVCTDCPAYIATKTNSEVKAQETANMWSNQFGVKFVIDDVWCDGCLVEGRKCSHCADCKIRSCAISKELENCAYCDDYPCNKLDKFLNFVPNAKKTLEKIRSRLHH